MPQTPDVPADRAVPDPRDPVRRPGRLPDAGTVELDRVAALG